ncbi:MAG: hypothetical protein ACWGKN_09465 [Desulfoprunum sp.]
MQRKKATPEELEENARQIMSEIPSVTPEMITEWDSQRRPARPGEIEGQLEKLYREGLRKKIPHPDPSIPGLVIR